MSLTGRDRKIVLVLVPLVVLLGYWFLILAPKQEQVDKVSKTLSDAQAKRDEAEQQVGQLSAAKASFASDYATVIRLGKAIPTDVDMPTLLVQLNAAAKGTGVHIQDLKPGAVNGGGSDAPSGGSSGSSSSGQSGSSSSGQSGSSSQSSPPGGGKNPAAPGAAPAQSWPGKQAQKAGSAVTQSNNQSQGAANATANGPGTAAGGTQPSGAASSSPDAPGLSKVPLTFTITGNYFNLADFFHRLKRFVRVVNNQIEVHGRLLSIDSFNFQNNPTGSTLQASVNATVYLSPADQGIAAGATAQGPQSGPAGGSASTPASGTSTTPTTPTATATP